MMSYPRSADEELIALERRHVSQTTHIKCAMCGETTKLSNRYKSPMKVEDLGNGLARVWFVCAENYCEYDLTTCITDKVNDYE